MDQGFCPGFWCPEQRIDEDTQKEQQDKRFIENESALYRVRLSQREEELVALSGLMLRILNIRILCGIGGLPVSELALSLCQTVSC